MFVGDVSRFSGVIDRLQVGLCSWLSPPCAGLLDPSAAVTLHGYQVLTA